MSTVNRTVSPFPTGTGPYAPYDGVQPYNGVQSWWERVMPAAVAAPLISAGATLGTGFLGSRSANRGYDRSAAAQRYAADLQAEAARQQLAYLQAQAAEDRRRYDEMVSMQREQWNAEQGRRAPYRAAGNAILGQAMGSRPMGSLGGMLGGGRA